MLGLFGLVLNLTNIPTVTILTVGIKKGEDKYFFFFGAAKINQLMVQKPTFAKEHTHNLLMCSSKINYSIDRFKHLIHL